MSRPPHCTRNVSTLKDLLKALKRLGIPVSRTGGGHIKIHTPAGPYFTASTHSDPRGVKNAVSDLRRMGLDL